MWFPIIGEHSLSGNTACRWYINPNLPEAHTVLAKYCLPTIVILLLFHTIPYCAIYCFMQLHSPQLITSFPLYTPIASTVVSSLCNTPQWISSLLFPSSQLLNQNRKLWKRCLVSVHTTSQLSILPVLASIDHSVPYPTCTTTRSITISFIAASRLPVHHYYFPDRSIYILVFSIMQSVQQNCAPWRDWIQMSTLQMHRV